MLRDTWDFLAVMFRFGRELLLQELYIMRYLKPIMRKYLQKKEAVFTSENAKRMAYYARFVPAVSGANYAILGNRAMSHHERMQMLKLSASAAIFDDYFDDKRQSPAQLKAIMDNVDTYTPQNAKEGIFVQLLREVKSKVVHLESCTEIGYKVFDAQIAALAQEKGNLSPEKVRQITFDKGGYSTVMFTYLMDKPEDETAAAAVYHFGGMIQWVDDIFDLYEDNLDGLQTLVTSAKDMTQLRKDFEVGLVQLKDLFHKLDYLPKKNILKFLDLQLFFFTRALVCLEQFETLQYEKKQHFDANNFTRKQLICDMEKWSNIRKWFQYFRYWKKRLAE